MSEKLNKIASIKSINASGSSISKNVTQAKRSLGNVKNKLKNMVSFNIEGPFSGFIFSCISIYLLYYFIKKALGKMEYNNQVAFIGHCVDYWFYIILILIVFAAMIQLF